MTIKQAKLYPNLLLLQYWSEWIKTLLKVNYHVIALHIKLLWCLVGHLFLCCARGLPNTSASAASWAALPAVYESREREQVCGRVMLWLVLLFRSKGLHL